jgi:hypothetical protein
LQFVKQQTQALHMVQSLEELYARLDQHILLAVGYCEVETLPIIIKMCRLKPAKLFRKPCLVKLALHKQWIDEFGNSLYLEGANKLRIVLNDLSIDRSKVVSTDLYRGVSVERISGISRAGLLVLGKQDDYCLLSLLGIDDYLRTFMWWRGVWQECSPLLLGSRFLQYWSQNLETMGYKELDGDVVALHRSKTQNIWLTEWPLGSELMEVVREWEIPALDFIKENNIE